jgi:Ribonuclease G/E
VGKHPRQHLHSVAPALIYEEEDLVKRAIRDMYDKDLEGIWVEGEAGYKEARDFMRMLMPSQAKKVSRTASRRRCSSSTRSRTTWRRSIRRSCPCAPAATW